jgi:hypothetical protein
MKWRQHQLASAQVLLVLLQQERLRPQQGAQDDVAPWRDRVDPIAGEEALDRFRIGEEDDLARTEQLRGERLPETAAPLLVERNRAREETRGLKRPR